jgi:hypothetical protein
LFWLIVVGCWLLVAGKTTFSFNILSFSFYILLRLLLVGRCAPFSVVGKIILAFIILKNSATFRIDF